LNFIFSIFATPLGYLLAFIFDVVGNYGITIIIFTFIVRMVLFPLYARQIKGQLKMQEVLPRMQEIQKKYANDKEQMNRRIMELYREEHYNPMSGCLPVLIQMPVLMGLFALLRNPMGYLSEGHEYMVMAVHEAFLWVPDLSQADLWILPIATGIAQFISMSIMQQPQGGNAQAQQMQGMTKMMRYFFPVMIVWMGRSFPAGLALYWFVGNILNIGQTYLLRMLRKRAAEKLAATKKPPKKK